MAKPNQSSEKTAEEIKENFRKEILAQKNQIEILATRHIRDAFFYFSRAPIATGASQNSSLAVLNDDLILDLSINTEYFKYVALGIGSNAKYGNRNPVEKASQNIFQGIINLLNV